MLCSSLTELEIPDSLESMGEDQFIHCSSLVIKVKGSNIIDDLKVNIMSPTELGDEYKIPVVYNRQSNEIADDGYTHVIANNAVEYALKDGIAIVKGHAFISGDIDIASNIVYKGEIYKVKEIGMYAFAEMHAITSINLPDSITRIGRMALAGCEGLTSIDLPDELQEIGILGLKSCINLKSIEIPSGVTSIGEEAFGDCRALERVYIPRSVTQIDDIAFNSCSSLTIYCEADIQPSGWSSSWNPNSRPVEWGYKGN